MQFAAQEIFFKIFIIHLLEVIGMMLISMMCICLPRSMRLKIMILVIYLKEKIILNMMILVIDEPDNEDDDIGCFENNTTWFYSKLMIEMGFDWNNLGKNGKDGDISQGKTHIEDDDSGDRWTR